MDVSGTLSFAVDFSPPRSGAQLDRQEQRFWKLAGAGQVSFDAHNLILDGHRAWPRSNSVSKLAIPYDSIFNVMRAGRLVQCQVRLPDVNDQALRFWTADEAAAQQVLELLPKQRSASFAGQYSKEVQFQAGLQDFKSPPFVTWALVAINCIVFVLTAAAGGGLFEANGAALIDWGTNFGPLTLGGDWWRLFTSMFLHFGILHLLLNMWALYTLGLLTEKLFGSAYFLTLYVFAGLCGSIASLSWNPTVNSAGASGAIFGVLGGLLAFMVNPKSRVPASIAAPQRNSALVFAAYNLITGLTAGGVDNAAHIGGLAGGLGMGWWLARPLDIEARRNPAPRLLMGVIAGIAILIAASWPLVHPDPVVAAQRHFRHQLQRYSADEEHAIAAQKSLGQLLADKKIDQAQWGLRVLTDVLPQWQAARATISALDLPQDSPLQPTRTLLLQYLDQKLKALTLLGEGARDGDVAKIQLGQTLMSEDDQKAEAVMALIRQEFAD